MDVSFNTAEIAVITSLLIAVVTALGSVFKLYIKAKDDQIAELRRLFTEERDRERLRAEQRRQDYATELTALREERDKWEERAYAKDVELARAIAIAEKSVAKKP